VNRGIRDAMHDDPYAHTRYLAAKQADQDMRRDEPWLWLFSTVVAWILHPWISLRLWWFELSMRR
jgi:hypothetical protein